MSDQSKTDKTDKTVQADQADQAKPGQSLDLEARAIPRQRTAAEADAASQDAGARAADEQNKANEQKLKDDADYAKAIEGTGGLLAPHLKKFRERRGAWHQSTPEDAVSQQASDQAAARNLVADLILQSGSGVMGVLTESEQAFARTLAMKLKQ